MTTLNLNINTDFLTSPFLNYFDFRDGLLSEKNITINNCTGVSDSVILKFDLLTESQIQEVKTYCLNYSYVEPPPPPPDDETFKFTFSEGGVSEQVFSPNTEQVDTYNLNISTLPADRSSTRTAFLGSTGSQVMVFSSNSNNANSDKTIFGISKSSDKGSSWEPCLVVTQNQKVGIGTNAPQHSIDITGEAKADNFVTTVGSNLNEHVGNTAVHIPLDDNAVTGNNLWSALKVFNSTIFGSNYEFLNITQAKSTTSSLTETLTSLLLPIGVFSVRWEVDFGSSNNRTDVGFDIEESANGESIIKYTSINQGTIPQATNPVLFRPGSEISIPFSGIYKLTVSSQQTVDFKLTFERKGSFASIYLYKYAIELFRIS